MASRSQSRILEMRTIPTTCTAIAEYATQNAGQLTAIEYAGGTTSLCLALNMAMEFDAAAQARYEAIYGEPWTALPMPGLDGGAEGSQPQLKSHAASTTQPTVR